jgi:hypothetical protein
MISIGHILIFIIYLLKICFILHMSSIRNITSHISRRYNNLIRITWDGIMCTVLHGGNLDFSIWRSEILHEIGYLVFYTIIMSFLEIKYFPAIHIFRSDQFSLLVYLCLLSSSSTVKMDNGENM